MSYKTLSTIHPFIHVYRSTALSNSTNYDSAGVSGFPYDTVDNSGGGLLFTTSTRSITIGIKGLYLINYCFNVRNNDNTITGDNIEFGVSIFNGTTFKKYYGEADPEGYTSALRYNISNSIFISCNLGDVIKGYVGGIQSSTHDFIVSNPGSTSLSVSLIAPYS